MVEDGRPTDAALWGDLHDALGRAGHALDERTPPGVAGQPARVLAVTLDDDLMQVLRDHIGRLDIVSVKTVADAEAKLATERFAGILVDLETELGALSLSGHAHGAPVVAIARPYLTQRLAAAHARANLFLTRPLGADDFAAVGRLLLPRRTPTGRVLVVSDDHRVQKAVGDEIAGHRTVGFSEPWRLFPELDQAAVAVLVVDLALPGVTGLDVCRMVRATPRWSLLPIILVASRLDAEARTAATLAGADACLDKPLTTETLTVLVHRLTAR